MPTAWGGETVLRWCIVNPLTTVDDLAAIVDSLGLTESRRAVTTRCLTSCRSRRSPLRGCVATMDGERRELAGGWVAITDGLVTASAIGTGAAGDRRRIDATDCLVTPGLVNTHHHLFQNLTRAYPPMTDKPLFGWLQSLYPLWRGARHRGGVPVGVGRAGRAGAVGLHDVDRPPVPAPARRRRPADGRDRGRPRPRHALPPDARLDVAVARRTAACRPTTSWPTTTRSSPPARRRCPPPRPVARGDDADRAGAVLAVHASPRTLMVRSAELAERLDVRLHTHFAENAEDDAFSLATFGCRPMEYLERTGLVTRPHLGRPLRDAQRRRGAPARARPASASPTARRAT